MCLDSFGGERVGVVGNLVQETNERIAATADTADGPLNELHIAGNVSAHLNDGAVEVDLLHHAVERADKMLPHILGEAQWRGVDAVPGSGGTRHLHHVPAALW